MTYRSGRWGVRKNKHMKKDIEYYIRRLPLDHIRIINYIRKQRTVATTKEISDNLFFNLNKTGGLLSSLGKKKINDTEVITPFGKTKDGMRWKLSDDIVKYEDFDNIVKDIL